MTKIIFQFFFHHRKFHQNMSCLRSCIHKQKLFVFIRIYVFSQTSSSNHPLWSISNQVHQFETTKKIENKRLSNIKHKTTIPAIFFFFPIKVLQNNNNNNDINKTLFTFHAVFFVYFHYNS